MTNPAYKTIPLKNLAPDERNARSRKPTKAQDAALLASIQSEGLLQSLLVRPDPAKDGRYLVTAGQRRLRSLQQWQKAGGIDRDYEVPCIVADGDLPIDSRAASLAENVERVAMHPLEQYDAIVAMQADNIPDDEIAARLGISDRTLRQRIALAKLSPPVRKAWEEGTITTEQAEAFTITPDAKTQANVLKQVVGSYYHKTGAAVRQTIRSNGMLTDDEDFVLVGRAAYEAAGGRLREDLFSTTENAALDVLDPDIVGDLVGQMIEAKRSELLADGWGFALREGRDTWELEQIEPQHTPAEKKKIETLNAKAREESDPAKRDKIARQIEDIDTAALIRAVGDRKAEFGCEIRIENGRLCVSEGMFDPETAAVEVHRKADERQQDAAKSSAAAQAEEPEAADSSADPFDNLTSAMKTTLQRQTTYAIACTIAEQPALAARALVTAAVEQVLQGHCAWLSMHAPPGSLTPLEDLGGGELLGIVKGERGEPGGLVDPDKKTISEAGAQAVAAKIDLPVALWSGCDGLLALLHSAPAGITKSYLLAHFDAALYFAGMRRDAAVAAIEEMGGEALATAKKSEVADQAARLAVDKKWLPPQMRRALPDTAK